MDSQFAGLFMKPASDPVEENNFIAFVNEPGNNNSLPNNNVSDIWCDDKDHIWITMNGGGALAEFDGKNFTRYQPANPGSSLVFLSLAADRHNHFWIITKNGLEVFDRDKKEFFHLDVNDGSANEYINPHFSNEENGSICFTSGNRIFSFRPDGMVFNSNFPELYLADMNVFGKSYRYEALHGKVKLNARERFVNFTAGAIQFTSPGTVKFQYKLVGLDEDWNNSDNGEIKYTNLPSGNFKLLVRVTNPAGQFSAEKVLAEFKIATPFYATWWFIVLCLIFIAASAYAGYKYRINQLLELQKMRNKIARDLHDDIGSTLGSISFLSEAARQQLQQNNPPGAEKMLAKIGDNSREMVENMSDIVWSVNPKNDSARFLIDRMRVFADDLVASSGLQLRFEFDKDVEDIKLTMEQRKNIFLIFKESVYNSGKYSGGKNLLISMRKNVGKLMLLIKDDGTGFDVNNYKSKNGNGIHNMRLRAEEIGSQVPY